MCKFRVQNGSISEICQAALEDKPKIPSKTKSELIEDYEYHIESILSGEFNEQFEI